MASFKIYEYVEDQYYYRPDTNSVYYTQRDAIYNNQRRIAHKHDLIPIRAWSVREYRDDQNSVCRDIKEVQL